MQKILFFFLNVEPHFGFSPVHIRMTHPNPKQQFLDVARQPGVQSPRQQLIHTYITSHLCSMGVSRENETTVSNHTINRLKYFIVIVKQQINSDSKRKAEKKLLELHGYFTITHIVGKRKLILDVRYKICFATENQKIGLLLDPGIEQKVNYEYTEVIMMDTKKSLQTSMKAKET